MHKLPHINTQVRHTLLVWCWQAPWWVPCCWSTAWGELPPQRTAWETPVLRLWQTTSSPLQGQPSYRRIRQSRRDDNPVLEFDWPMKRQFKIEVNLDTKTTIIPKEDTFSHRWQYEITFMATQPHPAVGLIVPHSIFQHTILYATHTFQGHSVSLQHCEELQVVSRIFITFALRLLCPILNVQIKAKQETVLPFCLLLVASYFSLINATPVYFWKWILAVFIADD